MLRAMRYFDTHSHFDTFAADGTLDDVLSAADAAGVDRLCAVGASPESNALVLDLAERHPGRIVCAVGLDREQALLPSESHDFPLLREQALRPCCRAIGEVGLDYHYSPESARTQRNLFEKMLALALDVRRPVVIHSREADADTLALLRDYVAEWARAPENAARAPAVLHCYTGGNAFADKLVELGLMISFSGILTFLNAAPLRDLSAHIPADRLLIETDCPYLAPRPYRGQTNQPAYVVRVAETLAETRAEPLGQIAETTHRNAEAFFALPTPPNA